MTTWLRHVAPAGAPIRLPDLAQWAGFAWPGGDVHAAMREAMCARFGVRHSFLTSTGRAGMTLLLRALRRLAPPDKDEVILPSYTCFSVAASVVKAGLKIRLVDLSTDTLDYDPEDLRRADYSRVLAIVATNLYGLPNHLPALSAVARDRGVFLIDDAAQAMGASVGGRKSGTWGDAGLFSFDKGKNVSAIDGGVLVTDSDRVASALAAEVDSLGAPSLAESGMGVAKALIYFAMLRPWLYWIPHRIPQLELGKTVFTTEFPLERPSRPLVALGLTMIDRLDEFTSVRTRNAAALLAGLSTVKGIRAIAPVPGSVPVYLRLPILADSEQLRNKTIETLRAAGIGATASYPSSLADVPALQSSLDVRSQPITGGREIARRILTLPTHSFVGPADVQRMVAQVRRVADAQP